MNHYHLLIELHRNAERQGPGGDIETKKAISLAGLNDTKPLKIADIGCGTGASSLVLASELNARITAVDLFPEFLNELQSRAHLHDVSSKINTLACSMDSLPFKQEEFDVIWSEGAIYNIGFEKGITDWIRYLKPGGKLIVSEITWLTSERPSEIQSHWETEYPEIDTASKKLALLEQQGYTPDAYFVLPKHCWIENYYRPMQSRFNNFLEQHHHNFEAVEIVESEKHEIELYEKYNVYFSYGVYIASKL